MEIGNEKAILLDLLLCYNNGVNAVRVPDIARRTGVSSLNIEQELSKLAKEHIMRRVTVGTYAFNVDIGGLRGYVLSKEPMGGGRTIPPFSRSVTVDEIANSVWELDIPSSERAKKEEMRKSIREGRDALRKRIEELERSNRRMEEVNKALEAIEVDPVFDDAEEDADIAALEEDEKENGAVNDEEYMFPQDDEEEDPILKMIREDLLRGVGKDPFLSEDDEDEDEDEDGDDPASLAKYLPPEKAEDDPAALSSDEQAAEKKRFPDPMVLKTRERKPFEISEFDAKVVRSVEESLAQQASRKVEAMERAMATHFAYAKKSRELLNSRVGKFADGLGGAMFRCDDGIEVVLDDAYLPLRAVVVLEKDDSLYLTDGGLLSKFFGEGELKADESRILFCLAAYDIVRRDGALYLDVTAYSDPLAVLKRWQEALEAVKKGNEQAYNDRLRKWTRYGSIFRETIRAEGTETREGAISYLQRKTSEMMNKDIGTVMLYVDLRVYLKSIDDDEYLAIRAAALAI